MTMLESLGKEILEDSKREVIYDDVLANFDAMRAINNLLFYRPYVAIM